MTSTDPDHNGISLLYVEDDLDSREILSEIISKNYPEFRLLVADNGKIGLDMFKRHRPEIVLTDINMPIADGIKMSSAIKAISPAAEIIALTAYTDTKYLLQAIELGFSYYILKPVDINHLFKVIDKTAALIRMEQKTERHNVEIMNLNAELASNKIELERSVLALESFSYTVAHDLRSPMVSISGYSQLLLDKYASTEDKNTKEYLETICREIVRMNKLIDVLLKFSLRTRQNPIKSVTSLSLIADEIAARLMENDPRRHLVFRIEKGINAFCDPDLLRLVLENLLNNAWKFSAARNNAVIEFNCMNTEEDIVYFVRDNGAGFDQKDAEKLFVPFQRLQDDANLEGYGIGLATVSRVIERHGGKIWAAGEKGEGATFYFTL